MAQICPRCGGKEIGCPVCHLPPKRKLQKSGLITTAFYKVLNITKLLTVTSWPVQGVDISSWNGIMNLSITKTKAQYGFIRAGYGNGYKDYRSDTYRQDANTVDWPYGLYWYCYPQYSWEAHAEGFAEVANLFPYQLDLVIDAETTTLGKEATLDWFINLDTRLQQLTGKIPIIYTSKGFWDEHVARSTYFSSRLNWIANWTTAPNPALPLDLLIYGHWQYSANGNGKAKEYGMVSNGDYDMDLDRANYTVAGFNTHYGTHIEPFEQLIPIRPIKYAYINTEALNMRSTPEVTPTNDIGTLKLNDDVPIIEEKNGWYRIEGWISKNYTRPK